MLQSMGSQRVRHDLVTEKPQQFIYLTNTYLASTMCQFAIDEALGTTDKSACSVGTYILVEEYRPYRALRSKIHSMSEIFSSHMWGEATVFLKIYYLFIFLHRVLVVVLRIFQHLGSLVVACELFFAPHVGSSSLTRDQTWSPCIERMKPQPLDHQGSPYIVCSKFVQCHKPVKQVLRINIKLRRGMETMIQGNSFT